MGIGTDLRNARLAQQRSIEDIARATKISSSVLRAIESDEFHKVPGGVFTRGYIRAYARDVGLNPEDIVERYRTEFEPTPAAPADEEARGADLPPIRLAPEDDTASKYRSAIELGVIGAITAVCFGFLLQSSNKPATTTGPAPSPAPVVQAQPDKSVATSGSSETVPSEVKIDLRATGPCWIEATSGDRRIVARLMNEGDTETVTVREDVTLRVGEPSALAFSIGGVPGRPLGPGGKPITVHISPQNYKDFLGHRSQR